MHRLFAVVVLLATSLGALATAPAKAESTQLTGSDAVATAISWSNELYDDATTAVLARSDSFADALAAGALAASLDAPFLVTPTVSLDSRVAAELDRLGVDAVRVIGGTSAVSAAVVSSLQQRGYSVTRIAGNDRVDTAVAVAEAFGAAPTSVVLARAFGTGTAGFADSLGGGALAASRGVPLVLTDTASLSSATASYLTGAGIGRVTIVGGTAAVSAGVAASLAGMGITVDRIAGANRFATAAAVLDESRVDDAAPLALLDGVGTDAWVSGFAASPTGSILLTSGMDVPDETAAALAAVDGAALVCAPQVAAATCGVAEEVLNGEDLVLASGRLVIPAVDVGDRDLTALPLGDDRVSTSGASTGDLYLCPEFPTNGGGAMSDGPWIHGDAFDLTQKAFVQGEVTWAAAEATVTLDGTERVLSGNLLPVDHTTGSFPIASSDPAHEYDQNPSSIVAHTYEIRIPANPTVNTSEQCVGGEVGFLLSGPVLNSPVDALGRDAVAHEVQDHCLGHPNNAGYHYHSVSPCVDDGDGAGHSDLVGYALDGFGIYGTRGEHGVVVTNDDLDECHGHTHAITWDGQTKVMYHYHATWEFPYAVGCFRGTSSFQGPVLGPQH